MAIPAREVRHAGGYGDRRLIRPGGAEMPERATVAGRKHPEPADPGAAGQMGASRGGGEPNVPHAHIHPSIPHDGFGKHGIGQSALPPDVTVGGVDRPHGPRKRMGRPGHIARSEIGDPVHDRAVTRQLIGKGHQILRTARGNWGSLKTPGVRDGAMIGGPTARRRSQRRRPRVKRSQTRRRGDRGGDAPAPRDPPRHDHQQPHRLSLRTCHMPTS